MIKRKLRKRVLKPYKIRSKLATKFDRKQTKIGQKRPIFEHHPHPNPNIFESILE